MKHRLRTSTRPLDRLLYFIEAREAARETKELVGGLGPHSQDPILGPYRFCNINREHDTVTRWVKTHVRDEFAPKGKDFLVPQVLVARIINEPATLARILPVLDADITWGVLTSMKQEEGFTKILRGAYMMPVHGKNTTGVSAVRYYLGVVMEAIKVPWHLCDSLQGVSERLLRLHGVGDFLANQVVTDLRYTPHWENAPDWETFMTCGPGTQRGMNRMEGLPALPFRNPKIYPAKVLALRETLLPLVSPEVRDAYRDPNNVCNTLCEFDKFERVLWDEKANLRHYTPSA